METRKSLPKTALARLYFIDRQIASGVYPDCKALASEYEVGTATIYRDIEYMRDMLNAPIEYCAKNRGWYYAEKAFRLPAGFASADDMLALGMAKSLLSLYKDTPLYESAKELIDAITAPLMSAEASSAKKSAWYEKRILVPPVASCSVNPQNWQVIIEAMKENKVLNFHYKGIYDNDYRTRVVRPYQVLFDNGVWFLYGYSQERAAVRLFSLSRIKEVSITNEKFKLPKDFDYQIKNDGSFFGVALWEKKHYQIEFASYLSANIKERIWAADQKIKQTKNGIIIDFTSTQYEKVLSWVLSYGGGARPIKPLELVKEWEKNIISCYRKVRK